MFANGIDKFTSTYAFSDARKALIVILWVKFVVRSFVILAGKSKRCGNEKLWESVFLGHIGVNLYGRIILFNFISPIKFFYKFLAKATFNGFEEFNF